MKCGVFPGVATLQQWLCILSKQLFFVLISLQFLISFFTSKDNSVGIVINLWVPTNRGSIQCKDMRVVFFPKNLGLSSGLRSPLFPWVKAAEIWSWSITQFSAEVTNEWSYTSTPSYAFRANTGTFCCYITVIFFKRKVIFDIKITHSI
jgi:hypothetical protein